MLKNFLRSTTALRRSESGATAVEYGLIAAVIALGILGSVASVRDGMNNAFNAVANQLNGAADGSGGGSSGGGTTTPPAGDTTAPTVVSIKRQSPTVQSTDSDALTFRVTFSEAVNEVDTSDFVVSGSTATVQSVQQVGTTEWDVTVLGGDLANLNGTVSLELSGSPYIVDAANNTLADGIPSGANENYALTNGLGWTFAGGSLSFGAYSLTSGSNFVASHPLYRYFRNQEVTGGSGTYDLAVGGTYTTFHSVMNGAGQIWWGAGVQANYSHQTAVTRASAPVLPAGSYELSFTVRDTADNTKTVSRSATWTVTPPKTTGNTFSASQTGTTLDVGPGFANLPFNVTSQSGYIACGQAGAPRPFLPSAYLAGSGADTFTVHGTCQVASFAAPGTNATTTFQVYDPWNPTDFAEFTVTLNKL